MVVQGAGGPAMLRSPPARIDQRPKLSDEESLRVEPNPQVGEERPDAIQTQQVPSRQAPLFSDRQGSIGGPQPTSFPGARQDEVDQRLSSK